MELFIEGFFQILGDEFFNLFFKLQKRIKVFWERFFRQKKLQPYKPKYLKQFTIITKNKKLPYLPNESCYTY